MHLQTLNNAKGQLVRQGQLVQAERSRASSAQQHAQTLAAEARKAQTVVQRQHDADMARAIDEATRLRVSALYTALAGTVVLCPCKECVRLALAQAVHSAEAACAWLGTHTYQPLNYQWEARDTCHAF